MKTDQKLLKLNDSQLSKYKGDDFDKEIWANTLSEINTYFPHGCFSLLDIGGGSGSFSCQVLKQFPMSEVTILDNSQYLLSSIKPHPRQRIILGSAEQINILFKEKKFDIISFNWLLHHLVSKSYSDTRKIQIDVMNKAQGLLSNNGKILVVETLYEGLFFTNLPGRIIFILTSSKMFSSLFKKMGANTAGCGVCFLSSNKWEADFYHAGYEIINKRYYDKTNRLNRFVRLFIQIKSAEVGQYWLIKT